MTDETVVIDTPDGIAHWVILSRMHQLTLELTTGMKAMRIPLMTALYLEGFIPYRMRGTKENKQLVLRALVDSYKAARPEWSPSPHIQEALDA